MSREALEWAAWRSGVTGTPKFTLLTLAQFHNHERGCAWPSLAVLSAADGQCTKTHRRNLRRLAADGVISVERRPGRPDVYRFPGLELSTTVDSESTPTDAEPWTLSPATVDSESTPTVKQPKVCTQDPSRVRARGGAQEASPERPPERGPWLYGPRPARRPDSGVEVAVAEAFAAVYRPRHGGTDPPPSLARKIARRALAEERSGVPPGHVLAGARRCAERGWGAGMFAEAIADATATVSPSVWAKPTPHVQDWVTPPVALLPGWTPPHEPSVLCSGCVRRGIHHGAEPGSTWRVPGSRKVHHELRESARVGALAS